MTLQRIWIGALLLLLSQMCGAVKQGKVYRIVPTSDAQKSLFVENASLRDKARVVVWTETDVPAQQWKLATLTRKGMATLTNVYTGLYLAIEDGKAVQSKSPCYFTIKEAKDGSLRLYYMDEWLYAPSTKDGTEVSIISSSSTQDIAQEVTGWQMMEVKEQVFFSTAMRNRMAEGFLQQYLKTTGEECCTFVGGGWGESETLEAVLDMYEQTGEERYRKAYERCYRYFKQKVGNLWTGGTKADGYHWYGYDFNDDVMWHIIGAVRASLLSGKKEYLEDAKRNFDAIRKRANLGYVELFRWAESSGNRNGTNSCINGPAEVAACYIGIAEADESYLEQARRLYANQRRYLFEPETGHVYDAVVLNPENGQVVSTNKWASTYNQGTMLGAATLLYRHYGNEMYRQDAERIVAYAMKHLCDEYGIVKVCQNADGDFQGFKGILMRYAGLYARTFGDEKVSEWLRRNAFHAYNNMNSHHFGHSAWLTKAAENNKMGEVNYATQAFGASTALSAAFAVPVSDKKAGKGKRSK